MHVEKPIKPGIDGIHTRDLIRKPIFDVFRRLFILQMIGNPGLQNVIFKRTKNTIRKTNGNHTNIFCRSIDGDLQEI